ncbi:phage portal protein, HK97 family [Listeria weihenstephanensis FSL R9-0317]|uniref:Portal protein n=1 Tax=Listeria weihenstephanensis TaxID=1006155 RepID=A0A1S7FSY7_9LIST|nr:phage portal protein [Listeria weihenstephanensis]AQY50502.1 portal protein [Listeria phage LWP01] [Listeria weihenstephanensis]AQY52648.1 portal protein [Listeria phage LWP01]EUJ41520.1 phage portal protein, HK97 family [Listeria weihenstephanensis FSL R9-0317]
MGLLDMFLSLGTGSKKNSAAAQKERMNYLIEEVTANIFFKQLAVQTSVNLIAKTLARCEFKTFDRGKAIKGELYYNLNIQPNQNQSKTAFLNDLVSELVFSDEGALVIQTDDMQMLVADSYQRNKHAVIPNSYQYVAANNYNFKRTFYEQDVLFLELNNKQIRTTIDGLYDSYGKLISGSIKNYNRKNAKKLVLNISALFDQEFSKYENEEDEENDVTEGDKRIDDLMTNRFKNFFSDGDSVVTMEEGLSLNDFSNSDTKNAFTSRDIRAAIDDVIDLVAMAFHIPRGLLKGDVADISQLTNNFLTFCINPIVEQIENELNRKLFTKEEYLAGSRIKISTDKIKSFDYKDIAGSMEVLVRIGAFSVNDVLEFLGKERIDEPWADEHIITKNYAEIEKYLKGGDEE